MKISDLDIKLIKLIDKAVLDSRTEQEILDRIRDVIKGVPEFNIREKARAYLAAKRLIQSGWKPDNAQIKKFCISMNKVNEHSRARIKTERTAEMLREGRAKQGIFFLSSTHSNPACGHKDYQGCVYVDRFWKNSLKDYPEVKNQVAAYIRNHNIMTVQHVTREPVFLVTRPYCKHFFVPVSIDEVLHGSVKKVRANHPEANVTEQNINYRKKFYKLRYMIHTVLGMPGEAKHDLQIIKKQD